MRRLALPSVVLFLSAGTLSSCTGTLGGDDAGERDVPAPRDVPSIDTPAASPDARTDASPDAGPDASIEVCPTSALCESFDDYTETTLVDDQRFGPWRAALNAPGAIMELDGLHTVSGAQALHVRIESGATAGARLYAEPSVPLVAAHPTHVFGRLRMFIEPSGTSVHWTFFGIEGPAEPSSPVSGRYASYILSSLPRDGVNTYSFVDGLGGGAEYQDCWFQGMEPMPVGRWACVSFEMDSVARRLRMSLDGTEIVAVDDRGQGCVGSVPGDSLWYGPMIENLFVGAWSFHPMDAPLEVWIDDVVVDTAPVACP